MKLREFENEQALDLLADIIEPIARIMADKKVEKMVKAKKPVLVIASHILKNNKKDVIEIVATMNGADPATFKFNTVTLLKDIVDIMSDPDIVSLFTSQSQMTDSVPSGSATENTEEEKQ